MSRFTISAFILGIVLAFSSFAAAQDVRTATGMPIPIGAKVIWGQVNLKGLSRDERKPSIYVSLLIDGAQMARAQANDAGYYYFMETPRDGANLLITVGGIEVGRVVITSAGGDRYDVDVDWSANSRPEQTGVIQAGPYDRSDDQQEIFDNATAAAKNKKADDAIKLFNELLEKDPKDFVAWTELGSAHFGRSKYKDAEKAYTKALELKPDFMLALMNLGKLYMAQKQFDKAVPVFTKATESDKDSADAFHYLGESYLQIKQGSKAVGALNEAIRLSPMEKAEVHLRLATLYNAAGLKDRAANEYKLFLEKKPDHADKDKLQKYIDENSK